MADGVNAKIYKTNEQTLIVESGGVVDFKTGAIVKANGTQVAHIPDPTGGATTDAEARAAIVSILNALENLGLVAAS